MQQDDPAAADVKNEVPPVATIAAAAGPAHPDLHSDHSAKRIRPARTTNTVPTKGTADGQTVTPVDTPRGMMATRRSLSVAQDAQIIVPVSVPESSPKIGAVSEVAAAGQVAPGENAILGADSNMDEPSFNDLCAQPVTKPEADVDDLGPSAEAVLPPVQGTVCAELSAVSLATHTHVGVEPTTSVTPPPGTVLFCTLSFSS
jgi:hypothetical protein